MPAVKFPWGAEAGPQHESATGLPLPPARPLAPARPLPAAALPRLTAPLRRPLTAGLPAAPGRPRAGGTHRPIRRPRLPAAGQRRPGPAALPPPGEGGRQRRAGPPLGAARSPPEEPRAGPGRPTGRERGPEAALAWPGLRGGPHQPPRYGFYFLINSKCVLNDERPEESGVEGDSLVLLLTPEKQLPSNEKINHRNSSEEATFLLIKLHSRF